MGKLVWRPAMWASINHGFSAYNIKNTADRYVEYWKSAPDAANFVDFAMVAGFIPEHDHERWVEGVAHFAPGTFDVVSLAVDRNLRTSGHLTFGGKVKLPNGSMPLPMLFERTFEEDEAVVVRPTAHGIKIVLASTRDGYLESEPYRQAAHWPACWRRRIGPASRRTTTAKKKVRNKAARKKAARK